jgi:cell division protein FtsL
MKRLALPRPPAALGAPLAIGAAALLFACALGLVTAQYRTRERFAELEVAQQETKTLEAEGARLRSDLGRAAQPATVEAVARRLGMHAIDPERTVGLVAAPPRAAAAGGGR